ncbi:MAG: hypothetical protein U0031_07990 [Thermomicrobiales bacterium]
MLVAIMGFGLAALLCTLAAATAAWISDVATVLAVGSLILGILAALTAAKWERAIQVGT